MGAKVSGAGLNGLVAQLDELAAEARREFGRLSAAQLNWRPGPGRWSVGQCLEHLIESNRRFLPVLERLARGEQRQTAWERWSPLSGLFGRLIERSLNDDGGRKYKAPARLRPSAGEVDAGVVERFAAQQRELGELIGAPALAARARTVVTSPIAGFITYSLHDACRIVVAHERRHLRQARRVTETPGFPASTVLWTTP